MANFTTTTTKNSMWYMHTYFEIQITSKKVICMALGSYLLAVSPLPLALSL